MIKMTMLLKRKPKIDHATFVRHHRETHGPLFRSIPEAQTHVLRYIQTHPAVGDFPVPQANFDGTAEIWFDSPAGMRAVLGSETYKRKVFPDEKTFLDHDNTLILVGVQTDIIEERS
ncbi:MULTISPECIES: EthD domain-containing protein [Roseobacteraceae]|uniref:EthD domain-containing protein n=1 Tax=Roseobacteraceae TaxID=2854170 RepID=UPI0013BABC98|nr:MULTISPECIES: EthD domain-containing protein [unclassified Salipiger]NDV53377.1 EthD domain-containing protein [Salipiger sp. PrR003]NDW33383.1 EthD domain-containing protein [Salipiger sp. PrR007]